MEEIKVIREFIELAYGNYIGLHKSKIELLTLLKEREKAINYTRCSLQLKDKEKMSFGQWKFSQGLRYISDHTYRNAKGELFDADVVNKTYDDYYNL